MDIEAVQQSLAPAARRLLGQEDGATFLQPSWEALAAMAAGLPFDEAHPRAHRSWLCQQYGDWTAVRAAVEAEPHWETRAPLRYRLGLARHHRGEPEAAIRLWLPLCWISARAPLAAAEGSPRIRHRDHQRHGIDRGLDKAVALVEPLRLRGDRVHENGPDSAELGGLQDPENCIAQ